MDKLKMHSPNFTEGNIAKLAELFPGCVTESTDGDGKLDKMIDFDLLRQELTGTIIEGAQERYRLDWPGKREALLTANAPIAKTLRPFREESVDFDTTKNLFIEGDNLDALKLLQENYLDKVKMIYIDPPYNMRKGDMLYKDNFTIVSTEYDFESGQRTSEGGRLVANSESNGRYHSDWLSMMFPRLKLSRNLLTDDGAIFISIDENEVFNLRKLCDEIFGEQNFVAQIIWQKSKKGDSKLIAVVHEYIICYSKNKLSAIMSGKWRTKKEGVDVVLEKYQSLRKKHKSNHLLIRETMMTWYRSLKSNDPLKAHKHYSHSDERGLYFPDNFAGPDDGRKSRPRHEILHPVTKKPCKKPSTGWRWDETKTKWAMAQDPPRIHFGTDESTIPNRKSYLAETSFEPFNSHFYQDGRTATLQVEKLLSEGVFPFPKNVNVIGKLINLLTKQNDIIVDFFAGSGSTAHACFEHNLCEKTNIRYVLVQLPEQLNKEKKEHRAAYEFCEANSFATNISEICKERIRRAGSKIKAENSDKEGIDNLDIGFRVLKVDSSNMSDIYYTPDFVEQNQLSLLTENIKEDRTAEDLLFQVLLDWGVDLSLPISKETIDGKEVFFVDNDALAACFIKDGGITEEFVTELAKRKPLRVVFRDAGFKDDSVKINVEQIFKLMSPHTDVKTI